MGSSEPQCERLSHEPCAFLPQFRPSRVKWFTVQHSILLLWKALKKGKPNEHVTIIWHVISMLPFCFCMSGLNEQSVIQHGRFLTGAVLVLQSDSCGYFVTMGLSWGGPGVKVHLMSLKQIHSMTWSLHETSLRWQMCCTGTETEMNGCQLAVVLGSLKLHVCAMCHISSI